MSGHDYDLVDRDTGDVVVRVRHMFPPDPADCCMCGKPTFDHWAVPYYCGPVLEGESEGGYRAACEPCYKRWEKWNDKIMAGRAEYASWFTSEKQNDH